MERCSCCGRPITWAFCPKCGNEQEDGALPPITVCPICGVEMVPFCAYCTYACEKCNREVSARSRCNSGGARPQ